VKYGLTVRTWDSLLHAKTLKNRLGVYPFWANLYPKIQILAIMGLQTHTFKVTTVKFGMRMRTWDSLPKPNFVKVA